jgi:hypothetical protein
MYYTVNLTIIHSDRKLHCRQTTRARGKRRKDREKGWEKARLMVLCSASGSLKQTKTLTAI